MTHLNIQFFGKTYESTITRTFEAPEYSWLPEPYGAIVIEHHSDGSQTEVTFPWHTILRVTEYLDPHPPTPEAVDDDTPEIEIIDLRKLLLRRSE